MYWIEPLGIGEWVSRYGPNCHVCPTVRVIVFTNTVRTRMNDPCARASGLPLSKFWYFFLFFFCLGGPEFWYVFCPFSGGGNFGLPSTRTVYSSSYGTGNGNVAPIKYARENILIYVT